MNPALDIAAIRALCAKWNEPLRRAFGPAASTSVTIEADALRAMTWLGAATDHSPTIRPVVDGDVDGALAALVRRVTHDGEPVPTGGGSATEPDLFHTGDSR